MDGQGGREEGGTRWQTEREVKTHKRKDELTSSSIDLTVNLQICRLSEWQDQSIMMETSKT